MSVPLEERFCVYEKCGKPFKVYPSNKQLFCSRNCQAQCDPEVKDKVWKESFLQASSRSILQQKKERETTEEMQIKSENIIPTPSLKKKRRSASDLQLPILPLPKEQEGPKQRETDTISEKKRSENVEESIVNESTKMSSTKEIEQATQPTAINDLVSFESEGGDEILPEVLNDSSLNSKTVVLSTMNLLDDSMKQLSKLMKDQPHAPYIQISAAKELRETMKVKLGVARHIRDLDRDAKEKSQ